MNTQAPEPFISIIMPVRNREDFVEASIESIRSQTYLNWELLVLDDGSDDDSGQIVQRIQQDDARILYTPFAQTGCTGKLKNEGIRMAKGELICFMDSDDLWRPDKLKRQFQVLQQYPHAGFAFTNGFNFLDELGTIESYFYSAREGVACRNFFEEVCSGKTGIRFPTLMIWKRFLTPGHLFRENRLFSDYSFMADLAHDYTGVLLYEILFERRVHANNATSDGWIADYEEHVETIERYRHAGKLSSSSSDRILYTLYIHWGATYVLKGRRAEGRKAFIRAWRYNRKSLAPLRKIMRSFIDFAR